MLRRNGSMEMGKHGGPMSGVTGATAGAGPRGNRKPTPLQQSPVTGAKGVSMDDLHPERVKELMNQGEEQAEQQVQEPSAPFGTGELGMPPSDHGSNTGSMPANNPPTGRVHSNVGRKLPNMTPVSTGHVPTADDMSGAMRKGAKRGGGKSSFYGD